jgi:flagellar hook assembly protein FlgD
MPTGQFEPGEMFIDVNVVKPGEVAEITLMPFQGGIVRLKVYNSAGELVRSLEAQYPATEKEVMKRKWDGKNEKGDFVASGVYVVYAQMPGITRTGRIIVLR